MRSGEATEAQKQLQVLSLLQPVLQDGDLVKDANVLRFKEGGWAYHEGHRADERMRDTALLRKIELTSLSRPLKPEDLSSYEYILGMDFANMAEIQLAADHWAEKFSVPSNYRNKVSPHIELPTSADMPMNHFAPYQCCLKQSFRHAGLAMHFSFKTLICIAQLKLMCSFLPEDSKFKGKYMEVPDPYFDDDQARKGFHLVRASVCLRLACNHI